MPFIFTLKLTGYSFYNMNEETIVSEIKKDEVIIKQKTVLVATALQIWSRANPVKAAFILGGIVGFILGTLI